MVCVPWKRALPQSWKLLVSRFPLELRTCGLPVCCEERVSVGCSPWGSSDSAVCCRPALPAHSAALPAQVGSVSAVSDPLCGSVGAETRLLSMAGLWPVSEPAA